MCLLLTHYQPNFHSYRNQPIAEQISWLVSKEIISRQKINRFSAFVFVSQETESQK